MMRKAFLNADGQLRAGWKTVGGAAVYLVVFYAVLYGLAAVFGLLFDAWNLRTDNLIYAPRWAGYLVLLHTDLCYAAAYLAAAVAGLLLTKRRRTAPRGSAGRTAIAAAAGVCMGAVLTAAVLALDSMRLERPLSEPAVGIGSLSAAAMAVLGSFSGEVLTKRLLFENLSGRRAAYAVVCAVSVLLGADLTNAFSVISALLMAAVGCVVYRHGGLWASTALRAGWSVWTTVIFAWPATAGSGVYRLYEISEEWLTGGGSADGGLGCAALWLALLAVLARGKLRGIVKRKAKTKRAETLG